MGYKAFWVGPLVAVVLTLSIIVIRIVNLGEEILAYGIISIICYLIFLIWAQISAPSGNKTVPETGSPYVLAATLFTAYSIHDFMVQNMIKNPKR